MSIISAVRTGSFMSARLLHERRIHLGNLAYVVFAALIVLLAFLPTGVSTTRQTISAYAHSPHGLLLRLAFGGLVIGSLLAAYEFWRSVRGRWGWALAGLTAVWAIGGIIDTVISINPVGARTLHGQIHTVVAVVSFSAVAATILVFLAWQCSGGQRRSTGAVAASVLALAAVLTELTVTATAATFMAGTAERGFFLGALLWMIAARTAATRASFSPPAPPPASTPLTPRTAPVH